MTDLSKFKLSTDPKGPLTLPDSTFRKRVLSLDQTVAKTGWSFFLPVDGVPKIQATGTMYTYELAEMASSEQMLLRALDMLRQIRTLISSHHPVDHMVHEHPPVANLAKMARPESSMLAAFAIRIAASEAEIPVTMITPDSMRVALGLARNAKKAEVRSVVFQIYGETWLKQSFSINEDIVDSIALGYSAIAKGLV